MDTIGRLREIMKDRDLSLYTLAGNAGVPYSSLYASIRRGGELSVETIEKLCSGLGIELYEFFMSDEDWDRIESYVLEKKNARKHVP